MSILRLNPEAIACRDRTIETLRPRIEAPGSRPNPRGVPTPGRRLARWTGLSLTLNSSLGEGRGEGGLASVGWLTPRLRAQELEEIPNADLPLMLAEVQ